MDAKAMKAIEDALDAADVMYAEFMEVSCNVRDQFDIYKKAHAKVKAARRVLAKADA